MTVLGTVFGYDVVSYGDPSLARYLVPGTTNVELSLREDVAKLLLNFATAFHVEVEPLRRADTGAHNPRFIGGTTTWSRHAAGIAMDLNWQLHPQGSRNTFTDEQEFAIDAILDRFVWQGKRLIRWGLVFSNPDEMHFEINQPPAVARAAAAANVGGIMPLSETDLRAIEDRVWNHDAGVAPGKQLAYIQLDNATKAAANALAGVSALSAKLGELATNLGELSVKVDMVLEALRAGVPVQALVGLTPEAIAAVANATADEVRTDPERDGPGA